MKKLYEKNELTFALLWIVVYCVLQSLANPLNKRIRIEYSASAAFCILQAVILFAFIRKNHLQKRYGLCKSPIPACRFLYYVPLLLLASGNLWNGVALNYSLPETICRIVCILARAVSFFCRSITLALLNFCVSSHLHCSVRLTQVKLSADTTNTTGGSGNRAARCVRL